MKGLLPLGGCPVCHAEGWAPCTYVEGDGSPESLWGLTRTATRHPERVRPQAP